MTLSISNISSFGFHFDITDKNSQTLTSIFSELLFEAELRYGVRNRDFTPVGIEFYANSRPRTYIIPGTKNISILLPESSMSNMHEAVFHLCHEVIHILGPKESENDQREILSIEEGLATYFQYEMTKKYNIDKMFNISKNYIEAMGVFNKINEKNKNFVKSIRFRKICFCDWSYLDILEEVPGIDLEIAQKACEKFNY